MAASDIFREQLIMMETLEHVALADELHDGVIQELSALLLQLETYERRLAVDPDAASDDLQRIKQQTRATLNELRALVTRLRKSDQE